MTKQQELSYDAKFAITLVLLFVLYPVGLILMFKWMTWPKWLKWVIAFPVVFIVLGIILTFVIGFLAAFNSTRSIERANIVNQNAVEENTCTKQCAASTREIDECVQKCLQNLSKPK